MPRLRHASPVRGVSGSLPGPLSQATGSKESDHELCNGSASAGDDGAVVTTVSSASSACPSGTCGMLKPPAPCPPPVRAELLCSLSDGTGSRCLSLRVDFWERHVPSHPKHLDATRVCSHSCRGTRLIISERATACDVLYMRKKQQRPAPAPLQPPSLGLGEPVGLQGYRDPVTLRNSLCL